MAYDSMTVQHLFSQAGSYSLVATYADLEAQNCVTSKRFEWPIQVLQNPKADFLMYPEELSIANPEVEITNVSTVLEENKYTWTVPGLEQYFEVHPHLIFPNIGTYKVTLNAETKDGCKDEITKLIEVKNDFNCFIPASFTPDENGINDVFIPVFSPYGLDKESFSMIIYDRWGHEVYASQDISKGWNGKFRNEGENTMQAESYTYSVRFKDLDGRFYTRLGHVLMLK